MVQATYTEFSQEQAAVYGDDGARALARACLNPDELTDEDLFILDAMFGLRVARVQRVKAQETAGGYDSGWETLAASVIDSILSYPQGHAWLIANRFRDTEFQNLMTDHLENATPTPCHIGIEAMRASPNKQHT